MHTLRNTILIVASVVLATYANAEETPSKKQYMGYGGYGLGYGPPPYVPAYGAPGYIPQPYGNPALPAGPYRPPTYGGLVPPYPGNYGGYPSEQTYPPMYQPPAGYYPGNPAYPGYPGYPPSYADGGNGGVPYAAIYIRTQPTPEPA